MNKDYIPSRRDYFAALAMQGLLASGDLIDDKLWPKMERNADRQPGEPVHIVAVIDLSWLIATWMERDEAFYTYVPSNKS